MQDSGKGMRLLTFPSALLHGLAFNWGERGGQCLNVRNFILK